MILMDLVRMSYEFCATWPTTESLKKMLQSNTHFTMVTPAKVSLQEEIGLDVGVIEL